MRVLEPMRIYVSLSLRISWNAWMSLLDGIILVQTFVRWIISGSAIWRRYYLKRSEHEYISVKITRDYDNALWWFSNLLRHNINENSCVWFMHINILNIWCFWGILSASWTYMMQNRINTISFEKCLLNVESLIPRALYLQNVYSKTHAQYNR